MAMPSSPVFSGSSFARHRSRRPSRTCQHRPCNSSRCPRLSHPSPRPESLAPSVEYIANQHYVTLQHKIVLALSCRYLPHKIPKRVRSVGDVTTGLAMTATLS